VRTPAAGRPAGALARFGWAMFDWANQPFFTLVTTFIFAPYFTAVVVGDPVRGQAMWGYTQTVAGVAIALMSPALGAIADADGQRKPWIAVFQTLCAFGCALLWFALPGQQEGLWLVLAAVVLATIGAEFSIVFNNALLPTLVPEERLGRLSGYAWALGYLGGLVALFFVLLAFSLPAEPLFGLDKAAHEHDRIVGPLSALWLVVFVLPMFLFTPDTPSSGLSRGQAVRRGLGRIAGTFRSLGSYRNIALFLAARMIFYDGLTAIFAFGGIYAAGIFGWSTTSLGIFGIVLTVFAAAGAAAGGVLDDRLGSKRTTVAAVAGLAVATLGVVSIATEPMGDGLRRDTVLFLLSYEVAVPPGAGLFATPTEWVFLVFGILVGVFGGPAQAASRTMLARLSPPQKLGEFYGLYALSGKATAFLAPFTVAVLTDAYDSQRAGLAAIVVFLIVGLLLFLPVREERARLAQGETRPTC